MAVDLNQQEILRVLSWAAGCDDEGFTDDADWPLVKRLAESININPASVVSSYAQDIGLDYQAGFQFDRAWRQGHV